MATQATPVVAAPTAYMTAAPVVAAPPAYTARPATTVVAVPPAMATRQRIQNQKLPKQKDPEEDEDAKDEEMRKIMTLVTTIVEATADLANRYPPPKDEQLEFKARRGPRANRPIGGVSVEQAVMRQIYAPPGLEHDEPDTGGASGSGLVRTPEDKTGGAPGPAVSQRATADERLDTQGLAVPMQTPAERSQAEQTSIEMAEAVLTDIPTSIVPTEVPTGEQVHEVTEEATENTPTVEEGASHPPTAEEQVNIKDHEDLVNTVLDEHGEPVFGGKEGDD